MCRNLPPAAKSSSRFPRLVGASVNECVFGSSKHFQITNAIHNFQFSHDTFRNWTVPLGKISLYLRLSRNNNHNLFILFGL